MGMEKAMDGKIKPLWPLYLLRKLQEIELPANKISIKKAETFCFTWNHTLNGIIATVNKHGRMGEG